ncbi:response regulator [Alsobacter sp. KACC 23698]|uniref:Response regulator n=1 Tax=Alsobacter sp. KACC 23698 TaxID=3149229 RepID=A0AAU7JIX6_9HYPH
MPTKRTILVVDDQLLVRFVMADMLAENGFDVIQAGDAGKALSLIDGLPDLAAVVSDIEMPGAVDGTQLARTIRRAWPDLPVVIVSGRHESPPDLPDGIPFLEKPVSERLLVALLRQMTQKA